MATGKYGLEAIGGLDVNNYVTPKQGIEDKSLAQGIEALGTAADQGFSLYKAKEGKDFRQEARGVVQKEAEVFGKAAGVQPNELQNADVKELNASVERLAQAAAIGGPSIKERAYFQVRSMVLDKIDKNPMLADVYREVGDRVLGDYSTMLDIYARMQAKAEELAGKDPLKELRDDVIALQSKSTIKLDKSPYEMETREELIDAYNILGGNVAAENAAAKARDERKVQTSEANLGVNQQYLGIAFDTQRENAAMKKAKLGDLNYASAVHNEVYQEVYPVFRDLNRAVSSLAVTDQAGWKVIQERARAQAQRLLEIRDTRLYGRGHQWIDDGTRQQTIAETDRLIAKLEPFISGDITQAKQLAEHNLNADNVYGAQALAIGGPVILANKIYQNASGPMLERMYFRNEEAARLGPEIVGGPMLHILNMNRDAENTLGVASGEIDPANLSPRERQAVKGNSFEFIKEAGKEGTPHSIVARENPTVWGNSLFSVVADGIDAQDTWQLTARVFSGGFDQKFSTFAQAEPNKAMHIAGTIIDAAPQMANSLKLTAQTIPASAGDIQWDSNRQMWALTGPKGMPTLDSVNKARAVVMSMNNHLFALESLSAVDSTYETEGKPRGLSPRQYYAAVVYGLDPSQMGLVAKESTGEQK